MGEGKHVVVALGKELFGIPVLQVETILADPKPVRIPRTPKMMLGVFRLRDRTLPAVDLRSRLSLPELPGEHRHVIVETPTGSVSLRVDEVVGIWDFQAADVEPPSTALCQEGDPFLEGIAKHGDRLIAILNVDHVVPTEVQTKIQKASKAAA